MKCQDTIQTTKETEAICIVNNKQTKANQTKPTEKPSYKQN